MAAKKESAAEAKKIAAAADFLSQERGKGDTPAAASAASGPEPGQGPSSSVVPPSAPAVEGQAGASPAEPPPSEGAAEDAAEAAQRGRCCIFSFGHRVCALPAVRGAAALAQSSYDAVKRSSSIADAAFSAAELGLRLAAGPAVLCAAPLCVAMAVPVCAVDFGLNRTLDVVECVAPCVKYDYEQAKKTAAKVCLHIITLPESMSRATVALLNTCPGRTVVKAVQLTTDASGKSCGSFSYCPKDCDNSVGDAAFRFASFPCRAARRALDAMEERRVSIRDRIAELR